MIRSLALAAVLVLATGTGFAHGDWPAKYGGLMSEGGEITMELVTRGGRMVIYVDDHGEPVDVRASVGRLRIEQASGQIDELTLSPVGSNRVESASMVTLGPGMRLTVTLAFENGIEMKARFRIKST